MGHIHALHRKRCAPCPPPCLWLPCLAIDLSPSPFPPHIGGTKKLLPASSVNWMRSLMPSLPISPAMLLKRTVLR
jgi:hypothetical protein